VNGRFWVAIATEFRDIYARIWSDLKGRSAGIRVTWTCMPRSRLVGPRSALKIYNDKK
jgi:hypothetical protein